MNIIKSQSLADYNCNQLISKIPKKLSNREDKFFDKVKKSNMSHKNKLAIIYDFMNELNEFSSNFTPCKKNCSACCHYEVSISDIEISHIEKITGNKRNKIIKPSGDFHGAACPFLSNGSCSIYEARPYVCRRHVTLAPDPHWCDPVRSNEHTFPLLEFSKVKEAFDFIRRDSGSHDIYDIRQVFSSPANT
ncbi:MAG: YkgJ family cysteine cluster protein [Motiliproteus sp.]